MDLTYAVTLAPLRFYLMEFDMNVSAALRVSSEPIAIVGNINLDIKTSRIAIAEGIMADGETSVTEIYETLGGGGANTALAAAALGGCVHFFGCIGSDALGDRLEAALIEHRIAAHLSRKPTSSGRSINLNWDNGSRHFISSLPNNRLMTAADIDPGLLVSSGCRCLLRSDVWFSDAMLAGGNALLLAQAHQRGIETYIDINWDPEWRVPGQDERIRKRREQLTAILPLVDYAHGNERELGFFTGCDNVLDACRFLAARGCTNIVVHRGAMGAASFSEAEGWIEVPAIPVKSAVSATGCGDVFCAAHMLLGDLPARDRLETSARIAAEHLSGARILIPRLSERAPLCRNKDDHARQAPSCAANDPRL